MVRPVDGKQLRVQTNPSEAANGPVLPLDTTQQPPKWVGANQRTSFVAAASSAAPASVAPRTAAYGSPNQRGSLEIEPEITKMLSRGGRDIVVTVDVPRGVQNAPVVLFMPGFKLSAEQYQDTMQYLASHGFVVARVDADDDLFQWDHTEMSLDASAALDWVTSDDGPLAGRVNPELVGLAGHSLGGKLATMTALRDERVKAVFAVDPVNQRAPDVFAKGQIDQLKVPLGLLGQTTDTQGGLLRPPSTPEGANFQAFFDKATNVPSIFAATIPGADHFDFTDGPSILEPIASVGGTAPREDVLNVTRTSLVGFFQRHLRQEAVDVRGYLPGSIDWKQREPKLEQEAAAAKAKAEAEAKAASERPPYTPDATEKLLR